MTLGSHQRTIGLSQVHVTPKWIIDATGPYDLDPCAADPRPWPCARTNWTTHGLDRPWPHECFVFLNPPFDRYEVGEWIARLAEHGNGICLLHARCETRWFEPIWQRAAAILFLANRINSVDQTVPNSPRIQVRRRSSRPSVTRRPYGCIAAGSPARW